MASLQFVMYRSSPSFDRSFIWSRIIAKTALKKPYWFELKRAIDKTVNKVTINLLSI